MSSGHDIHSIREAQVIGQHSLRLVFEDGVIKDIDLSPILAGKRFAPLRDPAFFRQVRINKDFETVEWPNGADFDPETLYNWEQYLPSMREAAERWRSAEGFPKTL